MSQYQSIKYIVLQKLQNSYPEIQQRFGIDSIELFGSVARGEDCADSDVDFLYTFRSGYATQQNLNGLYTYLKALVGRDVDLVSRKWIDDIFFENIQNDIITCKMLAGETS